MAHKGSGPVGLAGSTYVHVAVKDSGTGTGRAPAPDVAVGSVGSGLSGIESAGFQHAFAHILRPVGARVGEAVLQPFPGIGHHILDLAAPGSAVAFRVDEIPPVAHLEHVRAFAHTVPDHVEGTHVGPGLEVVGDEIPELEVAGEDHMPLAVIGLENLRIAEVVGGIAEIVSLQGPEQILGPVDKVRGSGAEDDFAVGGVAVVAGVVDVVQAVGLVVDAAAGADGSVLLPDGGAHRENLTQRSVGSTVLGAHTPDGVEVVGGVVVVFLQVQHLELAGLAVIERHGVTYTADSGGVVRAEAFLIGRFEEFSRLVPGLRGITVMLLVAGKGGRQGYAGKGNILEKCFHNFYLVRWLIAFFVMVAMFAWKCSSYSGSKV